MLSLAEYINEAYKVLEPYDQIQTNMKFNSGAVTDHFSKDRKERHDKIMDIIGDGKYLTSFVCYTGHPNGDEIHNIFDNGVVVIQNERTKRVVTELIARPPQIYRYWNLTN